MKLWLIARHDPIFKRSCQAVPQSVDASLREDIISDIYLEIREGRLHPRDIEVQARRFINAGFATWANLWGQPGFKRQDHAKDACRYFTERIEDESALAAFDQVVFENERKDN